MKLIINLVLLLSTSAFAQTRAWECINTKGKILKIEAEEANLGPFLKVTDEHQTISGFANVLKRAQSNKVKWALQFNANTAIAIEFDDHKVNAFWRLTNPTSYKCNEKE